MQTDDYKFGQYNQLENLYLKFFNHPDGQWIMKIKSAVKLHELLKKYNPTQVLELGTGIGAGTAVIASTLDNARVMTVESNKRLIEVAKEIIPFELKEKIQFEYSPIHIMKPIPEVDAFQFLEAYIEFPWANWDFVVIDGPGPFMYKGILVDLPGGDVFSVLPKTKMGTKFYIDGRKQLVKLIKRYLKWYLIPIEEGPDYILLERTDRPLREDLQDLINSDTLRTAFEEMKYFTPDEQ